MHWRTITVAGRRASYGHATPDAPSTEAPVVFLHGWALSDRTYRRSVEVLAHRGYEVLTPALPGFGGTSDLPPAQLSLEGYAAWVVAFLDAVGVHGPVTLVGHSFGGAVAIKTTHDFAERVGRLVLVNSIGGAVWSSEGRGRVISQRPAVDWGVHLGTALLSVRGVTRVLPVIAGDAFRHALMRPRTAWRIGRLAMRADLARELEQINNGARPSPFCGDARTVWFPAPATNRSSRLSAGRTRSRSRVITGG